MKGKWVLAGLVLVGGGYAVYSAGLSRTSDAFSHTFRMPEYGALEAAFSDGGGWFLNRLRGYIAWVYPDTRIYVLPQGFFVANAEGTLFGRITFVSLPGDSVRALWRDIARKLKPYVRGKILFNRDTTGEVTAYHWWIRKARFPTVFFPKVRRNGTHEIHVVIKRFHRWHRVEIVAYPSTTPAEEKKKIWKTVQTLRVLPAEERIPYTVQGVPAGLNAYLVPVPEGFSADGLSFPMGTLQEVSWSVQDTRDPSVFVRRDVISISAGSTMGVPVYAATVNGNPVPYQGGIVTERSQYLELIRTLWGGGWELMKVWDEPMKSVKRYLKNQARQAMYQNYGIYQGQDFVDAFVALFRKGDLYRYAILSGSSVMFYGWSTATGGTYASLVTLQVPAGKHRDMSHLLASVFVDVVANPRWIAEVRRENVQAQQFLNQWVKQRIAAIRREGEMFQRYLQAREEESGTFQSVLQEHAEFTSDMNEAWGNILGEKIYARDPSTGEIFYLDDVGGNYLRNPETGDILMGVGDVDASRLQSLGWQEMNLSYEPFD